MKTQLLVILASLLISIDFEQTKHTMPYDYEKAWQQVADFENKGLPESALKVVNTIYEEAKKFLPLHVKISLVVQKSSKKESYDEVDFLIGTHALLYRA